MATSSSTETFARAPAAMGDDQEVPLSLPETTMVIVASTSALWVLLYGALSAVLR